MSCDSALILLPRVRHYNTQFAHAQHMNIITTYIRSTRNSIVNILYLSGFLSTPTSVNATLGSTATFNCSATTGQPGWLVNGSLLSRLNRPDITTSSVGRIFSLHVPATEKYNNIVVRCVIAILAGDDLYSDPVVLRVQGMFSVSLSY